MKRYLLYAVRTMLRSPGFTAVAIATNEEHGYVDISHGGPEFSIGDRVHIIPNHISVAVNLHEQAYGVRGESVEETWKVEGRGKLQ